MFIHMYPQIFSHIFPQIINFFIYKYYPQIFSPKYSTILMFPFITIPGFSFLETVYLLTDIHVCLPTCFCHYLF